ncbi:hypothetical protein NM208_g1379 [Fusarium decemcellulare]|uniref:Uncharacterized protein n=1 Tax=Fusarium decemcellulare TaxID=57161 RepID=A0ACC1SWK8_9HYPO|nr:hypothetical protein NM208_g1379 [Fusarium decemcellulare]
MSSSRKLHGKHVLVIGGTNGIGRGVTLAAIQDGARVTVVGSLQATVDKAVKDIKINYPSAQVSGLSCDLNRDSLEEDLEILFDKIQGVDHIVMTAANSLPRQVPIQRIMAADIQPANRRLQVMILLAKVASRYLPSSRHSSLTFTSGSVADQPHAGCSVLAYMAQGTLGMVRGLALDMKPVRVNVVEPGYVLDTGLWSHVPVEQVAQLRSTLAEKNPTGSAGLVEDVAEAYVYVMKDGNCTGEIIKSRSGQQLV